MEKAKKTEIIGAFRVHEADTGSSEVQIAVMTHRIKELTDHLRLHKKDFASRRGLLKLVGRRAALLRYLRRRDEEGYRKVIGQLGLAESLPPGPPLAKKSLPKCMNKHSHPKPLAPPLCRRVGERLRLRPSGIPSGILMRPRNRRCVLARAARVGPGGKLSFCGTQDL